MSVEAVGTSSVPLKAYVRIKDWQTEKPITKGVCI
jgi:hypothetical protein